MSHHGDIQNIWSPSQDLFNDVSYVGLSETFVISTCLRIWGLTCYNFIWGYRIMVIIRICDLQVKCFPMMYHMLVYLKFSQSLYVEGFEVWDGIISHEDVGSLWYSESVISKSIAFQWCIKLSDNLIFYNLYMSKV